MQWAHLSYDHREEEDNTKYTPDTWEYVMSFTCILLFHVLVYSEAHVAYFTW